MSERSSCSRQVSVHCKAWASGKDVIDRVLFASYGTPQGEFNRGIYNRHLGLSHRAYDKYTSMVKPFTTNGYVSGSVNINTVQSYAGKGANAATPDHSPFAPMYNLGAIRRKAFVDQTSDSLIAAKQPAKFGAFAYTVFAVRNCCSHMVVADSAAFHWLDL